MDKKSNFPVEGIFNFLLLILGIAVMVGALQLGLGGLIQPGAGLFPFFAGLTIFVAALVVIASSPPQKRERTDCPLNKGTVRTLAALVTIFVAWIVIMPFLGYILVTFATVFGLAKVFGLKGWLKPLVLSAGTSLAVYILFDRLLYLDLPRGFWGQGG